MQCLCLSLPRNCIWKKFALLSGQGESFIQRKCEIKIHSLPSRLILRSWIHVRKALSLKRIQGAWTHFEHTTLASMQDFEHFPLSDITSYCWKRTTLDQNTGVRNAILVSEYSKVSKTQVISPSLCIFYWLNKFNDSLIKGSSSCLVCEKILSASRGKNLLGIISYYIFSPVTDREISHYIPEKLLYESWMHVSENVNVSKYFPNKSIFFTRLKSLPALS